MRQLFFVAALLSAGLLTSYSLAQPPEKKESAPAKTASKPEVVKVEKGKFSVEVTTKGVLEAEDIEEVSIKLEAWTGMTVVSAVPHGATVKKGDTLVKLDMDKINKAMKELELDKETAALAFLQAEEDYKTSQKLLPMDEAAAKLAYENSQEDYKRFVESDMPLQKRNAEFMGRQAKNFFDYASEELKQLEKMYKADDIKEETEEIIIRRQRDTVENARNNMLNSEKRSSDTLKYDLPRREHSMKEANERTKINWEKAQIVTKAQRRQKELAYEKTKLDRAKAVEKFDNMKVDYDKMKNIVAPADGIVYYGKATKGNWNSSSMESKLAPKGSLPNDEVFMTIVKSRKLAVRGTVDEKDRPFLKEGDALKAIPTASPDVRLAGKIANLATVPLSGSFEFRGTLNETSEELVPGMTCSVKIKAYVKDAALTVPGSAVSYDDDAESYVVFTPGEGDAKPAKLKVKIGRRSGDKVEVLEGLTEGQPVLKEKPAK
ncbi:MAG: HlyD family efflux transporter periplasmic adaptor subunit [Gemmatales bacterium]